MKLTTEGTGIFNLTDVPTSIIVIYIHPREVALLTLVSKSWQKILNDPRHWRTILKVFYEESCNSWLPQIQEDKQISSKQIYKACTLVIKQHPQEEKSSPLSSTLRGMHYRSIFSYPPILQNLAGNSITFSEASALTKEQLQLIKENKYAIPEVAKLAKFKVDALRKGLNPQVVLNPEFTQAYYERIPKGWLSEEEFAKLTLNQIKSYTSEDYVTMNIITAFNIS